jgi:hypothetical protein
MEGQYQNQSEGKKTPVGRPKLRWEDNIKTNLEEIGPEDVERVHLVLTSVHWRQLVNTVTNLRVPQKSGDVLTN